MTSNRGVVLTTGGTAYTVELSTLPTAMLRAIIKSHRLDCVTLIDGMELWTDDVSESFEERWTTNPNLEVNSFATQLAIACNPQRSWAPIYGTAVVTGSVIDRVCEAVWVTGLTDDQMTKLATLLKECRQ